MTFDPISGAPVTRGRLTPAGAQDIVIPVADGENNGEVRARGILVGDSGTDRNLTIFINGAATNVLLQEMAASGATGGLAGNTVIGQFDSNCAYVDMVVWTKTGTRRFGHVRVIWNLGASGTSLFEAAFVYDDASTVITSIGLRANFATGFAAGTAVVYEEFRLP